MDLAYGHKYEAFREEVRAFLAKHKDQAPGSLTAAGRPSPEACSWQRQLIQNGYATRAIPKDYGSYGAMPDILESRILAEEFSRARVSSALQNQGISMVVPTLPCSKRVGRTLTTDTESYQSVGVVKGVYAMGAGQGRGKCAS